MRIQSIRRISNTQASQTAAAELRSRAAPLVGADRTLEALLTESGGVSSRAAW